MSTDIKDYIKLFKGIKNIEGLLIPNSISD